MTTVKCSEKSITDLLAYKHAEDVFVPQCKTGSTAYDQVMIFDAWAMKKAWAHPLITGYEIKTDRSDFDNDEKWMGYLPYCNKFYFVCPSKMIQPEELPDSVGLMWVATTGTRLYIKKKAPHRDIENPHDLMKYVLMCRVEIVRSTMYHGNRSEEVEYWKQWLEKEDEKKSVGHKVSKKLQGLFKTRVEDVERTNRHLKVENERLQIVAKVFKDMGIRSCSWNLEEMIRERINETRQVLPVGIRDSLRNASETLNRFILELDKLEAKEKEHDNGQNN